MLSLTLQLGDVLVGRGWNNTSRKTFSNAVTRNSECGIYEDDWLDFFADLSWPWLLRLHASGELVGLGWAQPWFSVVGCRSVGEVSTV